MPRSQSRENLFWRALESLVEDGTPEFYEAVEINGEMSLLLVIDGTATLVTVDDEKAVTTFVGRLEGGAYTEIISLGEEGYSIEATYEHEQIPGKKMTIRADRWGAFDTIKDARAMFREWASSARMARVQTFLNS